MSASAAAQAIAEPAAASAERATINDVGAAEPQNFDRGVTTICRPCHSASRRAQQKACDDWRVEFNHVRPHEALAMQTPAEVYRPRERRLLRARARGFPESCTVVSLNAHEVWRCA